MREYAIGTDQDLQPALSEGCIHKLTERGVQRQFTRGDCLFHQGDRGKTVLVLLKGRVKVCLMSSSGRQTILRIHLPGSLVGLSSLASLPFRDGTAIAIEPVVVAELPQSQMRKLLLEDSALSLQVMRVLLDRLADLHSRVAELQAASVHRRLARALLALGRPDPFATKASAISLTHEDLSHLVSVRRPTVTSALNRFARRGLIEKIGRRIIIKDAKRLTRLLSA